MEYKIKVSKCDLLHLAAEHGVDVKRLVELQLADALEAFLEMRLYARGVLRL